MGKKKIGKWKMAAIIILIVTAVCLLGMFLWNHVYDIASGGRDTIEQLGYGSEGGSYNNGGMVHGYTEDPDRDTGSGLEGWSMGDSNVDDNNGKDDNAVTDQPATENGIGDTTDVTDSVAEGQEKVSGTDGRKLIREVTMNLESESFDASREAIEAAILGYGGYVEKSSYLSDGREGSPKEYTVTARIPAGQADAFLSGMGDICTVTAKSESSEDVTEDYGDKELRRKALETEYGRVLALLEQASDMDTILSLERKLSELRTDIGAYDSALKQYDGLTEYATVKLFLSEVLPEEEPVIPEEPEEPSFSDKIRSSFGDSLDETKEFFSGVAVRVAGIMPKTLVAVFYCLVGILSLAAVYGAYRLVRRIVRKYGCPRDDGDE